MTNPEWTAPQPTDRDIVAVIDNWSQNFKLIAAGQFAVHSEENPDAPLAGLYRALCVLSREAWDVRHGVEQTLERAMRGGDAVQVSEDDDPLGLADDPPEVP